MFCELVSLLKPSIHSEDNLYLVDEFPRMISTMSRSNSKPVSPMRQQAQDDNNESFTSDDDIYESAFAQVEEDFIHDRTAATLPTVRQAAIMTSQARERRGVRPLVLPLNKQYH